MRPAGFHVSLALAIGSTQVALAQTDSSNTFYLAYNQPLTVRSTALVPVTCDLMDREIPRTNAELFQARPPFRLDCSLRYSSSPPTETTEEQSASSGVTLKALRAVDLQRTEQRRGWKMFESDILTYTSSSRARLALCFGSGFEPPRNTYDDEYGIGLRFHLGFEKRNPAK